ncbi:MarC family protein [Sulfoacidibacillus ferrooxidans]|uniref:UPF0056 membrane protein n=1 Tax=Sulfoacidibacillus ferrooxidans TaxID=2005001 RepID=A0A9X1V8N9_9BACL|nr:hypothetical protein [Sulfoacidibacillus ferrooxidans]
MIIYTIHALVSVFAVMNPLGNLPIFMGLVDGQSLSEQRKTARKAIGIAFLILMIFLVLGQVIFSLFGITVDAFRVAGGILIFGIAYNLLHAKPSHVHAPNSAESEDSADKDDISVTPLATPLIAGPGTIATVMALAAGPNIIENSVAVFIGFSIVLIGTFIIFYYAGSISKHLGQTELNVISRLMGLLLAVIAVQMAVEGLTGLFPGLVH